MVYLQLCTIGLHSFLLVWLGAHYFLGLDGMFYWVVCGAWGLYMLAVDRSEEPLKNPLLVIAAISITVNAMMGFLPSPRLYMVYWALSLGGLWVVHKRWVEDV